MTLISGMKKKMIIASVCVCGCVITGTLIFIPIGTARVHICVIYGLINTPCRFLLLVAKSNCPLAICMVSVIIVEINTKPDIIVYYTPLSVFIFVRMMPIYVYNIINKYFINFEQPAVNSICRIDYVDMQGNIFLGIFLF